MRKMIWRYIALLLIIIPLNSAKAEEIYYTNDNGINMTKEEYNNVAIMFSEQKVKELTYQEFEKVKNGKIVDTDTIYVKTVSNEEGIVSIENVTEEEYNNSNSMKICNGNTKSSDYGYHETSYKRLSANLLDLGNNNYYLISNLTWKQVPATRSYDVYAFRLAHMTYSGVSGTQTYYIGNSYTNIYYNSSEPGYKGLSNGAGISMNLKDGSNITGYDMSIMADLSINEWNYSTAHVFVTYQHAQSDLTRDQSKSYTLSGGGLGNVLYYSNTTIRNKYDWMAGLELTTPI